jgi:hypothetical protein
MVRALAVLLSLSLLSTASFGQKNDPPKKEPAKRQAVGRQFSPIGTLLQRQPGDSWKLPELFATLYAFDELVALPGGRAEIELREGDVRLTLRGNLPELSVAPALESAVILYLPGQDDFAVGVQRGRAVLENRHEKAEVKGRVFGPSQVVVEVVLEKGSQVAVETLSRWPIGAPFHREAKKGYEPEAVLSLVVVKGKAELAVGGERHRVQAPALLVPLDPRFSSPQPFALKKLPDWLMPPSDVGAKTRAVHTAVEQLRRRLAEKPASIDLAAALKEPDPLARRLALLSAGAVDEVEPMLTGLSDAKYPGVRDTAVTALRHWIGRSQKHDLDLFTALQKKLTAGQAEIVMTLLHGFAAEDRARPETYDAMIGYLQHPVLAIRELARSNLYALVPAGKDIAFDAAAPVEERARAQAAWRKLIPEGQVPQPKN